MKASHNVLLVAAVVISAWGQNPNLRLPQASKFDAKHPPRFEDFPVAEKWNQPAAPLKLATRSERMFRTQLTNAAKEPPNFAGHCRFATWGCGSNCAAGAIVNLQTGEVFQPPQATPNATGWDRWIIGVGMMEDSEITFHPESRLVLVRGGMNYSSRLNKNVPDAYYFVWEENCFRRLLYIPGKEPER